MRAILLLLLATLILALACEAEPTATTAPTLPPTINPGPAPSETPELTPTAVPTLPPTATSPPTDTSAPTATLTPTATPAPGFGEGTWRVGAELEPGIYAAPGGGFCYWERLAGFGGDLDDIIANDLGAYRHVVHIVKSDAGFNSSGCGRWTPIDHAIMPVTSIPDGTWLVGDEVSPGTYAAPGGEFCYWARLRGFTGDLDDIITNDLGEARHLVDIAPTDAGFQSSGCGEWNPA